MRGLRILAAAYVVSARRTYTDVEGLSTNAELEPVQGLGELGPSKFWAAAIVSGDEWPKNSGVTFRVIDETGAEQEFNGKRYRSLDDLKNADSEIDGKYLVIPNRQSNRAISSLQRGGGVKFLGDLEGTKLGTLERDTAKPYGNHFFFLLGTTTGLQRAYKLGHDGGKLSIADGAPVPQAMFSVNKYLDSMNNLQSLFENNAKAKEVVQTCDYAAIAHIASVLAGSDQEDDVKESIKSSWDACEGFSASDITEGCVTDITKAYSDLDGAVRVKRFTLMKTHKNMVRAAIVAAGTSQAKLRDPEDTQEELLAEKKLKRELKSVEGLGVLGANAEAALAANMWATNAGATFRVINAEGEEQAFDGKRYRTFGEIIEAGNMIDGKYLVIPNKAARKELMRSKDVVLQGWNSIEILMRDCGREKPPKRLARAYKISHDFFDPTKFTLEDGAPVSQARFLMAQGTSVDVTANDEPANEEEEEVAQEDISEAEAEAEAEAEDVSEPASEEEDVEA